MILLNLALKSLKNRSVSAVLTVISIALSVALLLSVERTKRSAEEGFTQSISQTDLLVGARTGPLNLILFTVFNMGSASNNISIEAYNKIKDHPAVAWTIPYSLGDGHKGFRVVATDINFYEHYHFRRSEKIELAMGKPALGIWDVVLGSDVQKKLGYQIGDKVILDHGVTREIGLVHHDDRPFMVSGVLRPTGTAIDQSLYISLYGAEAMHIDWHTGAAPARGHETPASEITEATIHIDELTAFFVGLKSKVGTLQMQREINEFKGEPLLAILPGATLSDLWRGLSQIEKVLKAISWMVLCVGMASMLAMILSSMNERRREMAILRSLGAGPSTLALLYVFEGLLLTGAGIVLGLTIELSGFFLLSSWLENQFGFYLKGALITQTEFIYLMMVLLFGVLIGVIPAILAARRSLKDGLSV